MLDALDPVVFAGLGVRPIQLGGQRAVENIGHQRRFAAARNARDANQFTQRDFDGDVFEIVFPRADDVQAFAVPFTPFGRNRNFDPAREVGSGQ